MMQSRPGDKFRTETVGHLWLKWQMFTEERATNDDDCLDDQIHRYIEHNKITCILRHIYSLVS